LVFKFVNRFGAVFEFEVFVVGFMLALGLTSTFALVVLNIFPEELAGVKLVVEPVLLNKPEPVVAPPNRLVLFALSVVGLILAFWLVIFVVLLVVVFPNELPPVKNGFWFWVFVEFSWFATGAESFLVSVLFPNKLFEFELPNILFVVLVFSDVLVWNRLFVFDVLLESILFVVVVWFVFVDVLGLVLNGLDGALSFFGSLFIGFVEKRLVDWLSGLLPVLVVFIGLAPIVKGFVRLAPDGKGFVGLAPIVKGFADCPPEALFANFYILYKETLPPKSPPSALFELKRLSKMS